MPEPLQHVPSDSHSAASPDVNTVPTAKRKYTSKLKNRKAAEHFYKFISYQEGMEQEQMSVN